MKLQHIAHRIIENSSKTRVRLSMRNTIKKVDWSTSSEDYEGESDYSKIELFDDFNVVVTCNDVSKEYFLNMDRPVRSDSFQPPDYPVNPDDWNSTNELVKQAFGYELAK